MHAYQSRVSQPVRGAEGGADSHEDLNSSEATGQVEVSLSEAQLSAFWARIVANLDAARGVARSVSKRNVNDVVHTAALLFLEDAQRSKDPEPFPACEDRFRRKFLTVVRNHAVDCVRDRKRPACPIHCHWGIDVEPTVGGHNVADRELDTVFARNDNGKYDAFAPAERRPQDDREQLREILRCHVDDLPPMQQQVIHLTYFEGQTRAEVARCLGISVKTYDCHRLGALEFLRQSVPQEVLTFTEVDRSIWYDLIEELVERHDARRRHRGAGKRRKLHP